MKFVFGLLVWWFSIEFMLTSAFNRYNVPVEKLKNCREQLVSGEYGYHDFIHLRALNYTKLAKDEILHLKMFVSTESDAHVLLSANSEPFLFSNRDYEFVICGWVNTRSVLRQKYKDGAELVYTEKDPHLLSLFDLTPIEIIQNRYGNISLYVPGLKAEPLLTYHDPVPFDINYLSFGTFGNFKGRWLYDCPLDDEDYKEESKVLKPDESYGVRFGNARQPLCVQSALFQFQMDFMAVERQQPLMKARLNFQLNSTGSTVVLGNNIDLTTVCVKNVNQCPASSFACKISDIDINSEDSDFDIRGWS